MDRKEQASQAEDKGCIKLLQGHRTWTYNRSEKAAPPEAMEKPDFKKNAWQVGGHVIVLG